MSIEDDIFNKKIGSKIEEMNKKIVTIIS